jgi:hypothetical protein
MDNNLYELLLKTAEQNQEIIYKDNKVYAKLSWLVPWAKNPKTITDDNLEKIKRQIKDLGLYKPLLVCFNNTNAIILGGNQRFKALKELAIEEPEKYEYVWISLVKAWKDEEMLKYALSDNLNLGKYDRSQLNELVKPLGNQPALFKDYDIEISDPQAMDEFLKDCTLSENELKLKNVKAVLRDAGINDETIEIVKEMSTYNRAENKVENVDLKGTCMKTEKYPLQFWVEDKEIWDKLFNTYSVNNTQRLNTELLIKNSLE